MKGPKTNFKYKKSVLKKLLLDDNGQPFTEKDFTLDDYEENNGFDSFNNDFDESEDEEFGNSKRKPRKRKAKEPDDFNIEDEYEKNLVVEEPVKKKTKHLLPIITDGKLIRRMGVVEEELQKDDKGVKVEETEKEEEAVKLELERSERDLSVPVSTAELLAWRETALAKCRYKIGLLSADILEDPQQNVGNLKQLNDILNEYRPKLGVTVKKLVAVSLTEIFKDILPSYQIKNHEDSDVRLKKDTARLQTFEKSLLKQYRSFLKSLEKMASVFTKKKGDTRVHSEQVLGLGLIALNCMCDILVTHPYFNYAANIAKLLIPYLNNERPKIRMKVSSCITQIFKEDKRGELTLFVVRQINQYVKTRTVAVQSEVISVFLALKLKGVDLDYEKEAELKEKKKNAKHQQLLTMSKKEKKAKRRLKELEKELLETKAEENKKEKHKILTEVTKVIFTVYFRILKNSPTSKLICSTLEGIAKFAHTINLEFYQDLVHILCRLMDGGELDLHQQLLCVQAVFTILSGYGEALNIDPTRFYTHLYQNMLSVHAGRTYTEMGLLLNAMNAVVIKRRKRITQQRLLAYTKRTATLSMHLLHNGSLACLGLIKNILQMNKFTDVLLEVDSSYGQGIFQPELEEPEHCNAASTALFELAALRRHYHPTVCKMASHIAANVPTIGDGSLPSDLAKLSCTELFKTFSPLEMVFIPTIPAPKPMQLKGKPHFWNNKQLEEHSKKILSNNLSTARINIYNEVRSNEDALKECINEINSA